MTSEEKSKVQYTHNLIANLSPSEIGFHKFLDEATQTLHDLLQGDTGQPLPYRAPDLQVGTVHNIFDFVSAPSSPKSKSIEQND